MKESGAIDKAMFSLLIGTGEQQSKITFGGYDNELGTGTIKWHPINS
jgi:hypothetical protein